MGTGFADDDSGVSSAVEFILTFIIAAAIFSVFVVYLNSIVVMPKDTVKNNQYTDVGNDISTKLIDTYLVAPDNGFLNVTFDMPREIVGDTYTVSIANHNFDREVRVIASDLSMSVYMVLNGVNSTIPINGTTNSSDQQHIIKFIHQTPEGII